MKITNKIEDAKNFIMLPIRLIFSHEVNNKLGLKTLRQERIDIVKKYCRGKLLDIGCGTNELVKEYGNGVGADVYSWPGVDVLISDAAKLPFKDKSFDTISFVASLNHIPNRNEAIKEAHRVLTDYGTLLITMITPKVGYIRHKLAWWDKDQHERGMKQGEEMGLSYDYLLSTLDQSGFSLVNKVGFVYGLNHLYIFKKKET